jgi:hypothetical protein
MPENKDAREQELLSVARIYSADWTVANLKEYLQRMLFDVERRLDERITSQKEAVTLAVAAADRAMTKADVANEKRFESVNEFRQSLSDKDRLQMPRSEIEALFRAQADKLDAALKTINSRLEALSAASIVQQGQSSGIHAGWGYAIGAIGLVMTVVAILMLAFGKRTP